jgi:hypothetical protein
MKLLGILNKIVPDGPAKAWLMDQVLYCIIDYPQHLMVYAANHPQLTPSYEPS